MERIVIIAGVSGWFGVALKAVWLNDLFLGGCAFALFLLIGSAILSVLDDGGGDDVG